MNKELQQKIIKIRDIEQKARLACKPGKMSIKNYTVFLVDMANNDYIKNYIIKPYGYPNHKMIGKKGMEAFWLLIQHQDRDPKLQEQCLKNCDFNDRNKAYLIDRVLINQGKKQIYGTQLIGEIKDKKNVDKRRKEMGLESLEEYLRKSGKL